MAAVTPEISPAQTKDDESRDDKANMRKILIGTSIGNSLEWYDFALFAYFSKEIGQAFFPPDNGKAQLLEALAIYGSAFLVRPLGGLIFGYMGDKFGRVIALRLSIMLMALPTVLVGLMPTYAQIGWLSPLLLLVVRLLQGLSVGGEWIGSTVYVYECAPPDRRATYTALMGSVEFGFLLASATGYVVTALASPQALQTWAWRLPFLSGAFAACFGMWMRRNFQETAEFEAAKEAMDMDTGSERTPLPDTRSPVPLSPSAKRNPTKETLQTNKKHIVLLTAVNALGFTVYYLLNVWVVIYLREIREPPVKGAFALNTVCLLLYKLSTLASGYVSDVMQRGQAFLMQISATVLLLASPVLFYMLTLQPAVAGVAQALLVVIAGVYVGPGPSWMLGTLPDVATRYTTFGLPYNLAAALFGSSVPLAASALALSTFEWSPFLLLSGSAAISLCALCAYRVMHESCSLCCGVSEAPTRQGARLLLGVRTDDLGLSQNNTIPHMPYSKYFGINSEVDEEEEDPPAQGSTPDKGGPAEAGENGDWRQTHTQLPSPHAADGM
eukprot:g73412.t1